MCQTRKFLDCVSCGHSLSTAIDLWNIEFPAVAWNTSAHSYRNFPTVDTFVCLQTQCTCASPTVNYSISSIHSDPIRHNIVLHSILLHVSDEFSSLSFFMLLVGSKVLMTIVCPQLLPLASATCGYRLLQRKIIFVSIYHRRSSLNGNANTTTAHTHTM